MGNKIDYEQNKRIDIVHKKENWISLADGG